MNCFGIGGVPPDPYNRLSSSAVFVRWVNVNRLSAPMLHASPVELKSRSDSTPGT